MAKASFLSAVLDSDKRAKIEEINREVPKLKLVVDDLESKLFLYFDDVYNKRARKSSKLIKTSYSDVTETIKKLMEYNKSLTNERAMSNVVISKNIQNLETNNLKLTTMGSILKIHDKLEESTFFLHEKDFKLCMEGILEMENLITSIPEDYKEIESFMNSMRIDIRALHFRLIEQLISSFDKMVFTSNSKNTAIIKISNNSDSIDEILQVMSYKKSQLSALNVFTKFLYTNFFLPIVENKVIQVEVNTSDYDYSELKLCVIDPTPESTYEQIISNLQTVVQYLSKYFNFSLRNGQMKSTTVKYIDSQIGDNLSELIKNNCLVPAIPFDESLLKTFIKNVNVLMVEMNTNEFFSVYTTLEAFMMNIDSLFIQKKCEFYMLQCTDIIKNDVGDTTIIKEAKMTEESLSYKVSVHAVILIKKLEEIFKIATSSSDPIVVSQITLTCKKIISNYVLFVSHYQGNISESQSALFYNNCFYISDKLSLWKKQSSARAIFKAFICEINHIRQVGLERLSKVVNSEIDKIDKTMKCFGEYNGNSSIKTNFLDCFKELKRLKTSWCTILSHPVYNENMGIILNSFCNSLINCIINCKDISSKRADFKQVAAVIMKEGPELFSDADSKKTHLHVKSWNKLIEMNFLLGASNFIEIKTRWAGGKGSLGLAYNKKIIIQFIKVLFPNDSL